MGDSKDLGAEGVFGGNEDVVDGWGGGGVVFGVDADCVV